MEKLPSNSLKTSWPSYTFSPAENMEREAMHTNVSEAREKMSRTLVKAITKSLWEEAEKRLEVVPNRKRKSEASQEELESRKKEKIEKPLTPAQRARKEEMNTKKAAQITKKRKICENKETLELKESRAQKRNSKEEKEKQEGIVKVEKEVILDSNGKKRSAEWIKQRKKYQADQIADRQIITPQTRVIQFRLRLEPEMKKILEQRISVYCDIIQHAREVVYESLQKNEAWIAGALEGRICLTETRWKSLSTLEQTNLQDQERRKPYRLLQWEVQQEAIKEVMAAFKSCQTNLERGNISGYNLETDLDERLSKKCRRFLWMKFTNRMLTVNPLDGSVDLHWRALGFEKPNPKESCTDSVDRGLYLRDRLLPRIVKDQRIKEKEWTKAWGHTLKTNENGFELRLDTQRNKWYLQYCYESLHLDGPFFPGKAPDWYVKKRSFLFRDGCSRGSFGASDPGFRTPHTVYDFTNRKFIDILDDYLPQLKEMYRRVQRAEDWRLHTNKNPRYESRYQTLCHGPSTEKITKIRKIRRVKRKLENKGRQYRKDWKSRRYDDGGIRFSSESRQQQKLFVKPNSRSIRKAWDRIKTFGRHAHNITANYFVSQFDTFALPEFMTKGMIKKRRRKLGLPPPRFELDESVNHPPPPPPIPAPEAGTFLHKTTRTQAVRYGHFGNRQRIIAKFQSDPYLVKTVAITTEEFSTQQHPYRKLLHETIKGNKIWICPHGTGFRGRRDNVGGFNNGVKPITQRHVVMKEAISS